jgi:hypothetical protein
MIKTDYKVTSQLIWRDMYKLYFYVPEKNLEEVKEALFQAGAGEIGNYKKCAWQTKGVGQFLPGDKSDPHIGKKGAIEKLAEYKVEMVVEDQLKEAIINTLFEAHPYEEPAYGLIKIHT